LNVASSRNCRSSPNDLLFFVTRDFQRHLLARQRIRNGAWEILALGNRLVVEFQYYVAGFYPRLSRGYPRLFRHHGHIGRICESPTRGKLR
jgi:hypothetical protein